MNSEVNRIFELPDNGKSCTGCFMLVNGLCYVAGFELGRIPVEKFEASFVLRNRSKSRNTPPSSCQNGYTRETLIDLAERNNIYIVERDL